MCRSMIALLFSLLPALTIAQSPTQTLPSRTQIVLLGTGTPGFDIDRSGPATAIVVNGTAYLVDAGAGVVRRAEAAYQKGVKALEPPAIRYIFLTHLHQDHTTGYADLIYSPKEWREGKLEVYGPEGIKHMTEHLVEAYSVRRPKARWNVPEAPVNVHEIRPGIVYKDSNVTVTAFPVRHGDLIAYGYRFVTPDRTIVISGDTSPSESVVEYCNGCDVLIHEAYSMFTYNRVTPENQAARKRLHTSSLELAEIARRAKPGLLVLYHRSSIGGSAAGVPNPEDVLLQEITAVYRGKVVTGHDLDIF